MRWMDGPSCVNRINAFPFELYTFERRVYSGDKCDLWGGRGASKDSRFTYLISIDLVWFLRKGYLYTEPQLLFIIENSCASSPLMV
jgi:hypothetical protein